MKAYKGFNRDLTCRGFQYAEGESYETDTAKVCESGFHACEAPLDVLSYYAPASSVYHEVDLDEVDAKRDGDSKVAARKIRIGASVSLAGLAQAQVEFVSERIDRSKTQTVTGGTASNTGYRSAASNTGDQSAASNTGNRSAASNTGNRSAASNTGNRSAASNTGDQSAASNTGYRSAASNTGNYSAASNTGYRSAASNTGNYSAASNTGNYSAASNTGYQSAASNTGNYSAASNTGNQSAASVTGAESIAIVTGYGSRASGAEGCWIVLTERDDDWHILGVQAVRVGSTVDGVTIEPCVFYALHGGRVVKSETQS